MKRLARWWRQSTTRRMYESDSFLVALPCFMAAIHLSGDVLGSVFAGLTAYCLIGALTDWRVE